MDPTQKKRKVLPVDDEPWMQPPRAPVLRLRPTVPTELLRPLYGIHRGPDGPLTAHPGLIRDRDPNPSGADDFPLNITMREYRALWNAGADGRIETLREGRLAGDLEVDWIMEIHPMVDMQRMVGRDDDEIALAVERTYVGAQLFVVVCS
jgi:hypothetical protein